MRLTASLVGQWGPEGLDSSQGFSLGGPTRVRAYPVGEGDGPTGAVLSLDLTWRLGENWSIGGFYDHGRIADRTAPGEPSAYALHGAGLALTWLGPHDILASLTFARRFGDNPNAIDNASRAASIQGKDQDGSLSENRLWFTIEKAF